MRSNYSLVIVWESFSIPEILILILVMLNLGNGSIRAIHIPILASAIVNPTSGNQTMGISIMIFAPGEIDSDGC